MATIVTRAGKGSPLTNTEVDSNFTNLNTDKLESGDTAASLTITSADINGGTIDGATIGGSSAAAITGTTITGTSFVSSGDMTFGDNDKAIFGAGSDLQIYHDGSNSFIDDAGTGDLYVRADNDLYLDSTDGTARYAQFTKGGAATLRYNNSTKLSTTSTGIDVTGTVTADDITNSGIISTSDYFSLNSTYNRVADRDSNGAFGGGYNLYIDGTSPKHDSIGGLSGYYYTSGGEIRLYAAPSSAADTAATERMRIANNGDISFYENTGTTPKFFWDASAESLGIGTSSPEVPLHVYHPTTNGVTRFESGDATTLVQFKDSGTTLVPASIGAVSNDLVVQTNNAERMRIDSSGRVGIGTSSPAYSLHVRTSEPTASILETTTADNIQLRFKGVSGERWAIGNNIAFGGTGLNFDIYDLVNSQNRMRIDSSGNVGIGTSSPSGVGSYKVLQITGGNTSNGGMIRLETSNGTSGIGRLYTGSDATVLEAYSNDPLLFGTNATERMRIDSSGNLLVGTTTSSLGATDGVVIAPVESAWTVSNSGNVPIRIYNKGGSGTRYLMEFRNASAAVGAITHDGTNTTYSTSSDARLKENIVDASSASDVIDAIQVRAFDWKADGSHQRYGMVAQELLEVAPEAVSGDPNSDDMMGVDYSKLVPMLVKEIQDLRKRIAILESN
jgi:hypothetical protein